MQPAKISTRSKTAMVRYDQRGMKAVEIARDLIAFYPKAIHRPQPYVILMSPSKGFVRKLNFSR